jgi:hypothetical protein
MEIGMLVELRDRVGRRDRLLFTCATVPTFIILMTTVSCSTPGPEMPQRRAGIVEREQPKPTASPKVATVNAPKAKKANTPPRLDAQKEQQLFQEFLEWRERQKRPAVPPVNIDRRAALPAAPARRGTS